RLRPTPALKISSRVPESRSARPGMTLAMLGSLRPLGAVLRPALFAVLHALRIEHAAQDVVAHTRQILYAATTDHHHRMLLQVMTFARDVSDDFEAVGQADLRDLAERRVRLLRRRRIDARTDAALLRALLQGRHFLLRVLRHPRLANELIDRRHSLSCSKTGPRPFLAPRRGSRPFGFNNGARTPFAR